MADSRTVVDKEKPLLEGRKYKIPTKEEYGITVCDLLGLLMHHSLSPDAKVLACVGGGASFIRNIHIIDGKVYLGD